MTEGLMHQLLATHSPAEWLRTEAQESSFKHIDQLTASVVIRILNGRISATLAPFAFKGLAARDQASLDTYFNLSHQQRLGAWFLPEEAKVSIADVNLPKALAEQPELGFALVDRAAASVPLHIPEAHFTWAILEDLSGRLMVPLKLRGSASSKVDATALKAQLSAQVTFLQHLGLDGETLVRPFEYGGGWTTLTRMQRASARQQYLDALKDGLTGNWAASYRTLRLRELVTKYSTKAKKGPPKRAQVVSKELGRTLSAYFSGDWLAFLAYVDGIAHPDEAVITRLPEPRLLTSTADKTRGLAEEMGIEAAEIDRMLGAMWNNESVATPVEQRVSALRAFWQIFDARHAVQSTGQPSLWGLVQEGLSVTGVADSSAHLYQPHLYAAALPEALNKDIYALWGTVASPKSPETIIDATLPHQGMAEAFGPALRLWNGIALTTWFICEGPSSRTDLKGLAAYHKEDIADLERRGTPFDPTLFSELIALEKGLKPTDGHMYTVTPGVQVGIGMSKKLGFKQLRDVVTRHRRAWAEKYLDEYLRQQWEIPLRDTAREYSRLVAANSKTPTLKAFAKSAAPVADQWFGGHFEQLYAAIGERCPMPMVNQSGHLQGDRQVFLQRVFEALCRAQGVRPQVQNARFQDDQYGERFALGRLAEEVLRYAQAEGITGRVPTKEDLNWHRRYLPLQRFGDDQELGFQALTRAIREARSLTL